MGEALCTAAIHHNHTVSPTRGFKTPLELCDESPAHHKLVPFGTLVAASKPNGWNARHKQVLQSNPMEQITTTIPCVHVGYLSPRDLTMRLVTWYGDLIHSKQVKVVPMDPRRDELAANSFFTTTRKLQSWLWTEQAIIKMEVSELTNLDFSDEMPTIADDELLHR